MQEVRFNASLCRCAVQAAVTHEQHAFDACTNPTRYQNLLMRKQPALEHVPAAALAALCTYYCVAAPSPAPASTSASAPASASAPVNAASPATAPVIAPAPAASPAIALASFPAQDAALAMLPTAHAAAPASLAGSTAAGTPPSQAACCEGVAASCHPAAAAVLCGESLTHRTRGAEDEEQIQQRVESLFGEDADAVADAGTDAGAGAGRESDADAGPGAEVHAAADAVLHSTHASGGVAAVLPPVEPALVNSAQLEGSQPPGAGAAEAPVVTETAAPDPTGQRTDPEPVAASPAAPAQDEDCVPGASEHDLAVVDDAPTIEQPDAVARLSEPAPPSPPAPDGFADFLRERKVAERTAQRQRKRSRDKGAHAHGIEQRATNAHTDVNGQHSRSERAAHVDAAPAEAAGINHRHKAPEGTPSKKRMRDGSAEAVAAVRLQVQLFVGNMLEPLLEKRAINLRQYTEVLGRSVEKIMKVHSGSVDALFLESESKRVRRLVDRYVEFVKGAGAAADEQQN